MQQIYAEGLLRASQSSSRWDPAGNKTELSDFQEAGVLERRDSEQGDKDKIYKSSF